MAAHNEAHGVVQGLLELPVFHADWVIYFLLVLSLLSIAVMLERFVFYRRRKIDLPWVRKGLHAALAIRDYAAAEQLLGSIDSLETNVTLAGLREHASGPEAVEDLIVGTTTKEKERYDDRLNFLATLASNAPFIGLFGTVLGIIRSFNDLAGGNIQEASRTVMAGVAEALVATAVGLLVAIPAVIAFNLFKRDVKLASNNAQLLSRILLAHLKSVG